jgi:ribosomal RNA-processing protein 8
MTAMRSQLLGAHFRQLNESLYTCSSAEAVELFKQEPKEFDEYHKGFRAQADQWPTNPLDVLTAKVVEIGQQRIAAVRAAKKAATPTTSKKVAVTPGGKKDQKPREGDQVVEAEQKESSSAPTLPLVVGDFGCGDAMLALNAAKQLGGAQNIKVHSFDLVANNDRVTACDIANVPLPSESIDVAVFCLSLMGTNYIDFLAEAHRTLRDGGLLMVVEVSSRFQEDGSTVHAVKTERLKTLLKALAMLGFSASGEPAAIGPLFVRFDLVKSPSAVRNVRAARAIAPPLKPCIYKRR